MRFHSLLLVLCALAFCVVGANSKKKSSTTSTTTHHTTTSTSTSTSTTLHTTTKTTSSSTTTSEPTSTSTTISTTTSKTITSATSSASATPTKSSGKRGLSFNDPTLTQFFSLSGQSSKANWAYNWASDPYYGISQTSSNTLNPVLNFIPMLWSAASDLTAIWAGNVANAVANHGADSLLAFNEPDGCCWSCGNSCMNVSAAVSAYKQYVQPYATSNPGLKLGAPAVTNGVGSGIGLDYLAQFMGNCSGCKVDFIPLHFYGSVLSPGDLQSYVSQAWTQFGKPIWITEFGTTSGSDAQVLAWVQSVLPWLDAQPYVARYAYFMDRAAGAPYLMAANGSSMTDIGSYYNSG